MILSSVIMLDNFRSSDLLVDGRVLQKQNRTSILVAFRQFESHRLWRILTKILELTSILRLYSDSFVVYLCPCHVFLAEFVT